MFLLKGWRGGEVTGTWDYLSVRVTGALEEFTYTKVYSFHITYVCLFLCRDKLVELKKGEESKLKTYEALCIKLSHTEEDIVSTS